MEHSFVKYYSPYLFIPLIATGVLQGGVWAYGIIFVAFAFVPLFELFLPASAVNLTEEEEAKALETRGFDYVLYLLVPLQVGLIFLLMWKLGRDGEGMSWSHWIGAIWSVGIACGVYGINVAHELGHRKTWYEQWMAKILLLTSMYMHFFIEHNRGHHSRVATEEDPASARYGETVFGFWLRSVSLGYLSAWQIEGLRLSKKGIAWYSLQNEMLRFHLIQGGFVGACLLIFGWKATVAWLIAAGIGILLLETVNYIEHYGLSRKRKANGRYESVLPIHSWNSNHSLGRLLLFELSRHSDHHAHASRHYQILRHFEESPQFPTGYPGMLILAMMPPLWFFVMHRVIAREATKWQAQIDAHENQTFVEALPPHPRKGTVSP